MLTALEKHSKRLRANTRKRFFDKNSEILTIRLSLTDDKTLDLV